MIERVQKSSLAAILGFQYESYESALEIPGLEKLYVRRENICLRFIQKIFESERPFLSKFPKYIQQGAVKIW